MAVEEHDHHHDEEHEDEILTQGEVEETRERFV